MNAQHPLKNQAFTALSLDEAVTIDALFEQLFPADEKGPGASSIGVINYLDRALSGPYARHLETYRLGVYALDAESEARFSKRFVDADSKQQQELIAALENNSAGSFKAVEAKALFELARSHLQEGLFADPIYGGNRDKSGWRVLGHPGVWLENSAEENLTDKPVDKGGKIQSLADLDFSNRKRKPIPGFDPHRGSAEPAPEADIITRRGGHSWLACCADLCQGRS